jgi:alkylhydroperoxidase family enzyme
MARLPYVDPATAPAPVREALEAVPPLNVFRMIAHAETAFRPWLRFGGALLGATALDARLRELAILRVSRMTPGAEYEWVQHVPIALAVGCHEEQVAALAADDIEASCFSDDERVALRFTSEVVRDAAPGEATWAAASGRWSPRELIELLLVIGQYMGIGRIMATTRIDVDGPLGTDVAQGAERASSS